MKQILIILSCITIIVNAQEISTYTGNYPTDLSAAGEATYSYYLGKYNKKIRHGDFKYTLRQESNISKISYDVKGKYIHGLKSGTWTYKITLHDYLEHKLKNDYSTGTIIFTAGYADGVPHGKWAYSYNRKMRKLTASANNRIDWQKFGPTINERITMVFNNGIIVDSFQIRRPGYIVYGQCNWEGFYTGQWLTEQNGKQIIEEYNMGFLVHRETHDISSYTITDTLNNYNDFSGRLLLFDSLQRTEPAQLKHINFRIDTIQLLSVSGHPITQAVNDMIFNNPFLLFRSIEGDKLDAAHLKGLNILTISYQLTASEQEKLNTIHLLASQINKINNDLIKYTKDEQPITDVLTILNRISYFKRLSDKYICLADNYCSSAEMATGIAAAKKACANTINTIEPIPAFSDKNKAMDYFIADLTSKKKQAEESFLLVKTKLMPE